MTKLIMVSGMLIGLLAWFGPLLSATDPVGLKRTPLALQSVQSPLDADEVNKPVPPQLLDQTRANSQPPLDEESILKFAEKEQPQLFELLKFLKQKRPGNYQQALRDTGRTQQKLEALQQRDPELFLIEYQLWKTRSKLSLLAARLSVKHKAELEEELESLVKDLDSQEVARIRLMKDRAAKNLEKWDKQLKDRTADNANSLEKNLQNWKTKIKKQANARKKS
jgi:hypothetical protein